jgi:hypothetical protein
MSARYEFISVTLEIVAFFHVTIELYGKERLTTATDRLRCLLRRLIYWLLRHILNSLDPADDRVSLANVSWFSVAVLSTATAVATFLSLLLVHDVLPALAELWAKPDPYINKVPHFAVFAIGICALAVGIFASSIIVLAWMLFLLAGLAMILLDRLQFSGVMLFSGGLIFVFAKGMIWWHLLEHL